MDDNNQSDAILKLPRKKGFQPGHAKAGGRRKGIPTYRMLAAREVAEGMGFNPIKFLLDIVIKGTMRAPGGRGKRVPVSVEERLKSLRDVTRYIFPAVSAVELTGRDGGPLLVEETFAAQILCDPELARAAQTLALGISFPKLLEAAPEEGNE